MDPLSPIITCGLASDYAEIGRLNEALGLLDKLIEREPTSSIAHFWRSYCFMIETTKEKAFADWEAKYKLDRNEGEYKLGLAALHGWFGEREKALHLVRKLQEGQIAQERPWFVALCYAFLGDRDEFFAWIDKAINIRRFSAASLRYSPFFDNVRNDPRFPEIFKRLGLPS